MKSIYNSLPKILHNELKTYYKNYYAGKIKHPCDENCPDRCDGNHNYELPKEYPKFFNTNIGTK